MPVLSRSSSSQPDKLRAFAFHGAALTVDGTQAIGDCPFCGREGKFSVEVDTGLWRCWVCGLGSEAGGGNPLRFVRMIYERAATANVGKRRAFLESIAHDRRFLSPQTPAAWGMAEGVDGSWLVPGYGPDGRLDQVYRRVRVLERGKWVWQLRPTPGLWTEGKIHALHLASKDVDPSCQTIYVCEGPWDGMALWEVVRSSQVGSAAQVIAVPGCNVWRDEWTEFCRGKTVVLLFDNDHPREHVPGHWSRAGYDGMVRIARRLSGVASNVRWLRWGPDGYNPNKPSGWDVRDELGACSTIEERRAGLSALLGLVEDAPRDWFNPAQRINGHSHDSGSVEALPCSTYVECEEAWRKALYWREDLSNALAVLLAVCASTRQAGNQLFLDLIGSPGSAKTTLCRGLLVSSTCIHLENATKLISGYKKPGDSSADCSFLARANGRTWVTCEFDVLASSPQYRDLMGKVRRIFDGETSATYGNDDQDRIYAALRTPWIRAGTHKMVDHDQSQLGDRFLRYVISDPDESEKRAITRRAIRSERSALVETANATSGSLLDSDTRRAYALTGGYVDWLRVNAEKELLTIQVPEWVEECCIDLAEFSADMRARPTWEDRNKSPSEANECKELPTRLARQFMRLASCLAVVLNRREVDPGILRIVRKVALDTAAGHTLNMVGWLCSPNPRGEGRSYQECGGLMLGILEQWTGMRVEVLHKYLTFLRKIGVLEWVEVRGSKGSWILTERVYNLYLGIHGAY